MSLKEINLPSGAKLKITLSSFAVSKALYQAILEEMKAIRIAGQDDVAQAIKDIFCTSFSSKKVEACLLECMKKVTYNDLKVDDSTFEPEEARQDYMTVCMEVAKENVLPFTKNLFAEYSRALAMMPRDPA